MQLDLQVFNFIHQFVGQYFVLDWIFIFLAKYLPYIVVLLLLISLFRLRDQREKVLHAVIFALAALFSRGILVEVIRFLVPRERPFMELNFEPLISGLTSASMPSGHASFFFALAFVAIYLSNHKGGRLLIYAILISLGRVYVGVHYPLDIITGALVGYLGALAAYKLLEISVKKVSIQIREAEGASA